MFYNFSDHTTDMDLAALQHLNHFQSRYECSVSYHLRSESKRIVLGEKTFVCRFCGRDKRRVSFRKKAHAIPHVTGNRCLFSDYECDDCNEHFGRMLENEFGNFMLLNHIVYGVRGKVGRSKFVLKHEGLSIVNDGHVMDWQGVANEKISYDREAGILTVDQRMPGYVPVAVYKTLVKIGLTIMPKNELVHFKDALDWINERSHTDTNFPFTRLWMLYRTNDSNVVWNQLSVVLSKRKVTAGHLPYMLLNLKYANFDFQLPLPLCKLDSTIASSYTDITYLPHLHDLAQGMEHLKVNALSMHGRETVRGQEMTFTIKDLDGSRTVEQIKVV